MIYLPDVRQRVTAIANLAATCKTLHTIATPVLYHQPMPSLAPVQTLGRHPHLVQHVKSLYYDIISDVSVGKEEKAELLTLVDRFPYRLPNAYWPWGPTQALKLRPEELLQGLLIAMCSNVQNVLATLSNTAYFPFSAPGSLPSLRWLHVAHDDEQKGTELGHARPLFEAAPNLNKL